MANGKPKLSQVAIVDAAIELIEEEGLDNLSTRALGKRLGVQAMALYYHVPSKDALLDRITERLAGMIEFPPASENWRKDLEAIARSYVGIARQFPRAFPLLAARRFNTPDTLQVLENILSIYARSGLPPEKVAASFRILGYFLGGAGLAEGATAEAEMRSDFHQQDPNFLSDYPLSRKTIPYLAQPHLSGIFETGLKAILDFIEAEAMRAAASAARTE